MNPKGFEVNRRSDSLLNFKGIERKNYFLLKFEVLALEYDDFIVVFVLGFCYLYLLDSSIQVNDTPTFILQFSKIKKSVLLVDQYFDAFLIGVICSNV